MGEEKRRNFSFFLNYHSIVLKIMLRKATAFLAPCDRLQTKEMMEHGNGQKHWVRLLRVFTWRSVFVKTDNDNVALAGWATSLLLDVLSLWCPWEHSISNWSLALEPGVIWDGDRTGTPWHRQMVTEALGFIVWTVYSCSLLKIMFY